MTNRDMLAFGAVMGVLMCVLLLGAVLAGIYAWGIYSAYKADKDMANYNARVAGTAACNRLGYESYDQAKNLCYTTFNQNYNKAISTSYHEQVNLQ